MIAAPDGGGSDGGTGDGGTGGTCRLAECATPDAGLTCAFAAPDAGPQASCIADTCLLECGGGRSCDVTDGGRCLACAGAAVRCGEPSCTAGRRCTFGVSSSTCTGLLDDGTSWAVDLGADCRAVIANDAGVLGTWVDLDTAEAIVNIPRLGGYCVAKDLFTGAPRTQIFCPFCSFVAFGCD